MKKIIGLCFVMVACSSNSSKTDSNPSSVSNPQSSDGGNSADTDAGISDLGSPVTVTPGTGNTPPTQASATQQACLDKCSALHPAGAALAKAIDVCWANSCNPSCTMEPVTGKIFGTDAGALQAVDAGVCSSTIETPSADCSDCTAQNCCTAWTACYVGSADCQALDLCSTDCWALP